MVYGCLYNFLTRTPAHGTTCAEWLYAYPAPAAGAGAIRGRYDVVGRCDAVVFRATAY